MKQRHKRLIYVIGGLAGLAIVAGFVFNALNSNMQFFFSPTEVLADKAPKNASFRLGGLVEEGSLVREDDGLTVHFNVTDNAESIRVTYKGILPDLFREGQGIVTQGKFSKTGSFVATEVLAKHDEEYMPPEVADALEKAEKANRAKANGGAI
ncbi:MAG TPA: cytochrome c maturation protein CcmE [Gammaproteobacteria bacterium]|nr:cytochrome c maturation protein CcmE [Gammaproteobacteria bacterium]